MSWVNDIINYFTYLRVVINAARTDEHWKFLNLKLDWLGRAWFVLNIRLEDTGDPEIVKEAKVVQRLKDYHSYFESTLELAEIVTVSVEKKTEQSYLIVYYPLFKPFFIWRVFKFFAITGIGVFIFLYFNLWDAIVKFIINE